MDAMDLGTTTVSTMTLSVPVEQQAPCFFLTNYVISPVSDVDTPRGYFDFLGPLLRGEGPESQLTLAFSAVSMASLANRPSSKHRADLKHNAVAQYTRALKATNLALQNPAMQKTDATLAAVLMLGFYEVGHLYTRPSVRSNVCRRFVRKTIMPWPGIRISTERCNLSECEVRSRRGLKWETLSSK
jgi:hypothetical protein